MPATGAPESRAARVALAHEWLRFRHGSEKTFEQMAAALPEADLYALTLNPSAEFAFGGRRVSTTFLDRIPQLKDRHAVQLPLMPLAWRYAGGRPYEVVVTSSHACAKGFRPGRAALHLCYCYTPMRYVWLPAVDRRSGNPLVRLTQEAGKAVFRRWDRRSAGWVDEFAAISNEVRRRIERIYGREAVVIYPPVDTGFYLPGQSTGKEPFAMAVARLVPYKRIDLAIRACRQAGIRLRIAGWGPQEAELRRLADDLGAEVDFCTQPSDGQLRDWYRRASVCLFPAEEDFGIVPVEAQACGTPVVALARGGSLDTVLHGVTGVLVDRQTPEAFAVGIRTVLEGPISPDKCREHAEKFSAERFRAEFGQWVAAAAARRGLEVVPAG